MRSLKKTNEVKKVELKKEHSKKKNRNKEIRVLQD